MSTIKESHHQHLELVSEIDFMNKEIDFLMRILRSAYCPSLKTDKVKTLDSYWKIFEEAKQQINQLLARVRREEHVLFEMCKDEKLSISKNIMTEDSSGNLFKKLYNDLKTYKESFYSYMSDCQDCLIKRT